MAAAAVSTGGTAVGAAERAPQLGDASPGTFALMAQQHMARYGTTREQIARVAVKNSGHGALNPYAQRRKALTIEEGLGSPMIADPLTLYSCCPNSDGAAAVVLAGGPAAPRCRGGGGPARRAPPRPA